MTRWITDHLQLILCSYVIDELREVVARKLRPPSQRWMIFWFAALEMCYTPTRLPKELPFEIRDPDDEKVLYSAIIAEADILITGDKDFADVVIENLDYDAGTNLPTSTCSKSSYGCAFAERVLFMGTAAGYPD
jgi:predicted nucleic acid-binding protein